jgi:hypothetical protein
LCHAAPLTACSAVASLGKRPEIHALRR